MTRPRAVLVTGGAHRVGAVLVRRFAGAGHRVVIHHRSSVAAAADLCDAVCAGGGEAMVVAADLADADAVGGLIDRALALARTSAC